MTQKNNRRFLIALIGAVLLLCVSAFMLNLYFHHSMKGQFQNDDGIEEGWGKLMRSKNNDYTFRENLETHTIKIIQCNKTSKVIKIPATIQGYTVTALGELSFGYMEYVEEIVVPDTVDTMEQDVFVNNPKLKVIRFKGKVNSRNANAWKEFKGKVIREAK